MTTAEFCSLPITFTMEKHNTTQPEVTSVSQHARLEIHFLHKTQPCFHSGPTECTLSN